MPGRGRATQQLTKQGKIIQTDWDLPFQRYKCQNITANWSLFGWKFSLLPEQKTFYRVAMYRNTLAGKKYFTTWLFVEVFFIYFYFYVLFWFDCTVERAITINMNCYIAGPPQHVQVSTIVLELISAVLYRPGNILLIWRKRMFLVQLLFESVSEPGKQQVVIGNNHITRDG